MTPRYARLAGKILATHLEREGPPSGAPPMVARADRENAIAAIERAIRAKARQKTRLRWAIGLGAAAAAVLCVGVGGVAMRHRAASVTASASPATSQAHASAGANLTTNDAPFTVVGRSTGGVTVSSSASTDPLAEGKPLAAGSRVISRAGGRALLAFSTGTQLTVEEGSDMTIVDQGATQVFALGGGALKADVAKLRDGQRFLVRTADAEVEVRGTSFRVSVAPSDPSCGAGTVTRVAVYEGAVVVRQHSPRAHEDRVAAGEAWPANCAATPVAAPIAAPAGPSGRRSGPRAPIARAPSASDRASGPEAAAAPSSPSSLAEQNDRFAEAIAAKRSGSTSVAIARFERFLATYPSSALAESAAVERMKLLAATDPSRGAAAARQYLARYPAGFARAEAEAIVAERP
jgi:hypothetical protein